jgi:hypothetical protein
MRRGTDLLDFARLLHKWGANVTAIKAGTKRPSHKWQHWQDDRQTLEELERLPWDQASAVGVVNGSGGFRIFDIDAPKADDGRPLAGVPRSVLSTALQSIGLPVDYQWAYISGSGAGFGFVIRCDEDMPDCWDTQKGIYQGRPANGHDFDHLELRWSSGQTVIVGEHPIGPGYRWLRSDAPFLPPATILVNRVIESFESIAEVPQKTFIDELTAPSIPSRYGQGALLDAFRNVSGAANGTRNNTLFQQTAALVELVNGGELNSEEVVARMTTAALMAGLPEAEVRATVTSAFRTATASRSAPQSKNRPRVTAHESVEDDASPWADLNIMNYPPEDGGIADAWLEHCGDQWLYVTGLDDWYRWTGTHWEADPGGYSLRAEIQDLMTFMNREARAAR